jgi:hypothetical protein
VGTDMRAIFSVFFLLTTTSLTYASDQSVEISYFLFVKDDGQTWCGYSDKNDFSSAIQDLVPTESARVTYNSMELTEVTYQATPESGDWIITDKYTPDNNKILFKRVTLLSQSRLQVIQESTIDENTIAPPRTISISMLDGKNVDASNVDLPEMKVMANLSDFSFMKLVKEMRDKSIAKLCEYLPR